MPSCSCLPGGSGVSPEDDGKGYDGPPESRRCTDVLCLIVFILFCGVGIGIGIFAIQNGNPNSLIYGKDEFGNVCGSDNSKRTAKCQAGTCYWADGKTKTDSGDKWAHELTKGSDQLLQVDYSGESQAQKFTAYPRIQDDLIEGKTPDKFFGVCLNKCMDKSGWVCSMYGKALLADMEGMEKFPEDVNDEDSCPGCAAKLQRCQDSENPISPRSLHIYRDAECAKLLQSCFFSQMPTVSTMFRCFPKYNQTVQYGCDDNNDGVPDDGWHKKKSTVTKNNGCGTLLKSATVQQSASGNEIYEQLNAALAQLGRMVNDLQSAMVPIIVCGVAVAMGFGFLWLGLLRYCAKVFVWLTIYLIIMLQVTLTIFFYDKAGMVAMNSTSSEESQSEVVTPPEIRNSEGDSQFFRWCGIGMTAVLIVQLVTIASAVKKINVATQIIAEASAAVSQMKSMMFYPVFPVILISIIFVWFLYVGESASSMHLLYVCMLCHLI